MDPRYRLAPEYGCHALWEITDEGDLDNFAASSLEGLPDDLAREVEAWDDRFHDTYVPDDPASSGFASEREQQAHDREGLELARRIATALGEAIEFRPGLVFRGRSGRDRLVVGPG